MAVQDELRSVFTNATVRAQAFNNQVKLTVPPDPDGFFKCSLQSKKSKSLLTTMPENETEEEAAIRLENEGAVYVWSGGDTYDKFGELAKLYEFEDLVDEEEQIHFLFYPDGETTGPTLKIEILKPITL